MPNNTLLFEEKALDKTHLFSVDRDSQAREKLKKMDFFADAASPGAPDFVQRINQFITVVQSLKESQLAAQQTRQAKFQLNDKLPLPMDYREESSQTHSENDSWLAGSQPEELNEENADSEPSINLIELSLFAFSYFRGKYIDLVNDSSQQSMVEALHSLLDLCSKLIKKDASRNAGYTQILTDNRAFLKKQALKSPAQNSPVISLGSPSTPLTFVEGETVPTNRESLLTLQIVRYQEEFEDNVQALIEAHDEGLAITGNSPEALEANRRTRNRKDTTFSDKERNGFSSGLGSDLVSRSRPASNTIGSSESTQLSRPHKIVQWAQLIMLGSYIGMITAQVALNNPPAGLETATTVGSIAIPAIMLFLTCSDYYYWHTAQDQGNPNLEKKKKAARFAPLIPCLFLVANALKFAVDEHAVDAVLYSVLILIGVFKGLASKGAQNSEQNNSEQNNTAIEKFGAGLLGLVFAGYTLNSAVTAWSQQTLISALQIPGGGFMDAMSQAAPIISGAFLVAVGVSIALKAYNTYQLHDEGIKSDCSESGTHNP